MKNGQIIELPLRQRALNGDKIGGLSARIVDIDGNLVEIEILATGRRCYIIAVNDQLKEWEPAKRMLKIFYHTFGLWLTAMFSVLKYVGTISWPLTWVFLPLWGPALLVLLVYTIGRIFNKKN